MMHALLRFLLLHLLTCLGLNAFGSKIINGEKVRDDEMLYMASVQNSNGDHICGGFLISDDIVVTAAHCDKQKPTSVLLGTHNLKNIEKTTMKYNIKRCKHPSFVNLQSGHDIMLLKLTKKVQRHKRVKPIKIPKTEIKIKENKNCSVAGWGSTRTRGEIVNELQMASVPFVDLNKCKREWREIKPPVTLPDNVICAGGYETNKGFCQGDSGGPLVCNGMAVGVVSFNMRKNCDYPNVPNIYTNLSKYLHWIKEIRRNKTC